MIKQDLGHCIYEALKGSDFACQTPVLLETPKSEEHGDYALTIAFSFSKTLKQNPAVIAAQISDCLSQSASLEGLSFVPLGGFINIRLSDAWIFSRMRVLFDSTPVFPSIQKRLILEYVSANPTGPLHIGHGRWAVLGSAIARLLTFVGVPLHTEFYINDAGNQVAHFYASVEAARKGLPTPENGYHGEYIQTLAGLEGDPLQLMLQSQKGVLDRLGVSFDAWFSESSLHASGAVQLGLDALSATGYTYTLDGALWFKSSEFGDEKDRVLIKADGSYTYFAVDVAYHYSKIQRGFETLVNIWGADHHGYVMRVKAAVEALAGDRFDVQNQFKIIIGQLVNLLRNGEPVRMSKRTGDMISVEEVMDEIGVDATRFYLMENKAETHIEFDLEVAKKTSSENPVFYCQYAHARLCRVFSKLEIPFDGQPPVSPLFHLKERELLCTILQFQDEVWDAALNYAPHRMVTYLKILAKKTHHFYEACPILTAEGETQRQRLWVALQAQTALSRVLGLLGLSAPEQM